MSELMTTNDLINEIGLIKHTPFTHTDYEILQSYHCVVDGLATLIGSHCEIVLHSLDNLTCSAVKIANGQHTGRKIGSPITDLALRMLHEMSDNDKGFSKAYYTRAKAGALMKSVTIAIRNKQSRAIGLLCININLDVSFSEMIQSFVPPKEIDEAAEVNFAPSIDELVSQTIDFSITEVNADCNVANNVKNRQIVLNLYQKGIFDIKDAVNQVAERLNISKHTVYLYIRQHKSGDFNS